MACCALGYNIPIGICRCSRKSNVLACNSNGTTGIEQCEQADGCFFHISSILCGVRPFAMAAILCSSPSAKLDLKSPCPAVGFEAFAAPNKCIIIELAE